jgi:hypothetical protein
MRSIVSVLALVLFFALGACSRLSAPLELKKDALFGELNGIARRHQTWKPLDFEGSTLAFENEPQGALALVLVTPVKGSANVWGMARHLPVRFEHYRVLRIVPKKIHGTETLVGTFEVSEDGMTSFVRSVTWKKGGVLYDTLLITPKKNPQESLDFFKDLTLRVLRVSLH